MSTSSAFATTAAANNTEWTTISDAQWYAYRFYTLFDNQAGSIYYVGGMILVAILLSTIALSVAFYIISNRPLSREPTDQELQRALDSAKNKDIEKQLKKAPKTTNAALPKDFAFSTDNEQDGSTKTAKTTGADNVDQGPDAPSQNDAPAKNDAPAQNSAITPPELNSKK
ncbi:hypothetical protein AAVH_01497 [Aphelenchoides avenae]|nr:hypothetical protein AAVH_01497 [Aphelenchus avenae]